MYNIFLIKLSLHFKTYSLLTTLFVFYTYIRTLLCVSLCTKNYYSSNQVTTIQVIKYIRKSCNYFPDRGSPACRKTALSFAAHVGARIARPYLACSSSHRCISAFIPAKAFAVSGFSVLKSSSFHSQPCSATARRLSG